MTDLSELTLSTGVNVTLVQHVGSDAMIAAAARVSTGNDLRETDAVKDAGLLRYLMRNRHGTPFEVGSMTTRVSAPVAVWWEHVRHRVAWSYSLESSRYREMPGRFYIPEHARTQSGKPGHYLMTDAPELDDMMAASMQTAYRFCWEQYQRMLAAGVARELARMVLPFGLYFDGYTTCNPRSLMAFLSLRTEDGSATFPSKPQKEIQLLADQYEELFAQLWPVTHEAWCAAGRVAP